MMHPDTELKYINDVVGHGVFARKFIPKGTITYVKDSLEIEISPEEYLAHPKAVQDIIEKYSFVDPNGYRIVSWDIAKYVNHCCNCNTMSSGYGFEIAIRDIQPGEQITDEYGLFNVSYEMDLVCSQLNCRRKLRIDDFDTYQQEWDAKVHDALGKFQAVDQPLMQFLDTTTVNELNDFFADPSNYKSVIALKHYDPNLRAATG